MNAADLANMPAFPLPDPSPNGNGDQSPHYFQTGMTLRQHYAGKFLAAILSNDGTMLNVTRVAASEGVSIEQTACQCATSFADALIVELTKPVTP